MPIIASAAYGGNFQMPRSWGRGAMLACVIELTQTYRRAGTGSITTALVFYEIARSPGISMAELRRRTGLQPPDLTRQIKALLSDGSGLIVETQDPVDRRRKNLQPSPRGEALIRALGDVFRKCVEP